MKPLLLCASLTLLSAPAPAESAFEYSLRHTFGEQTLLRLLVEGDVPLDYRLVGVGELSSGDAAGEDGAIPVGITVDSGPISAGSLALSGLLAEIRTPIADYATTSQWQTATGLEADMSVDPVSRVGVIMRLPLALSVAGWQERERTVAAVALSADGEYAGLSGAVVSSFPPGSREPAEGWSEYDGPPERALFAALSGTLFGAHAGLSLAAAVSAPRWSRMGLWVRVAANAEIHPAVEFRLYGAAASPSFRDLHLNQREGTVRLSAAVVAEPGPFTLRTGGAWAGLWLVEPSAHPGLWWKETDLFVSGRWKLVETDAVGAAVETDAAATVGPADVRVLTDQRVSLSVAVDLAGGLFVLALRQRLSFTETVERHERLRFAIDPGTLALSDGQEVELSVRAALETEYDPFAIVPEVVLSGRYRFRGSE